MQIIFVILNLRLFYNKRIKTSSFSRRGCGLIVTRLVSVPREFEFKSLCMHLRIESADVMSLDDIGIFFLKKTSSFMVGATRFLYLELFST